MKTEPSDTEYALSYVSADTSVATVSLDGKITGVSDGKTEITVSSGELSDSIIVIVKKDIIEKLDVSLAALSLDGGEEQKVTARLTPLTQRMYRSAGKVPIKKLRPLTRTEI